MFLLGAYLHLVLQIIVLPLHVQTTKAKLPSSFLQLMLFQIILFNLIPSNTTTNPTQHSHIYYTYLICLLVLYRPIVHAKFFILELYIQIFF